METGAEPALAPAPAGMSAKLEGEALAAAIVRQPNTFQIVDPDAPPGRPLDDFAVHISGRGTKVRAKVAEGEGVGTYTVSFTPETSGEYRIEVFLKGAPLPGCPYVCVAFSRTPHAPLCSIVGEALHKATSREQQHAEDKDQTGQAFTQDVALDAIEGEVHAGTASSGAPRLGP